MAGAGRAALTAAVCVRAPAAGAAAVAAYLRPPARSVDAAASVCALAFAALAALSHRPPVPLALFGLCMAAAWLAFALLLWRFAARPGELPVARVVTWCLVLRGVGLFADPVLEDDFYRYLWDGRSVALLGSPYAIAPAASFGDASIPIAFQRILDGINHPDLPTIYGPVSQLAFGFAYVVAPAALWPLKGMLLAADAVALCVLHRLGGPRALLVFALCPLAIHESAFNAHPDGLGVACALVAFAALARGRTSIAAIAIAFAVGTKAIALVVLPLLVWRAGPRRTAPFMAIFAATLMLLYAPFLALAPGAELPVLLHFGQAWEFNSTLYAIMAGSLGQMGARVVAGIVVAAALAIVVEHDRRARARGAGPAVPRADWLLGALFLAAPVVNPWYLLWLLPFVALRPSWWGCTALCVVSLSYVHGLFVPGLPAYHHPVWLRPLEVAAIGLAAWLDLRRGRSGAQVATSAFDEGSVPLARGGVT